MNYNKPSKAKRGAEFYEELMSGMGKPIYTEEFVPLYKKFLTICEGKNTEPKYFEKFPVPTSTVITDGGRGTRTALINYALSIKDLEKYQGREIWCVFDYDIHPEQAHCQPEDFNAAIEKAEANGLKVAWSNDAFELWFVLHYHPFEMKASREELYPILKKSWNLESFHNEAKTEKFCEGLYELHGGRDGASQALAIKRAKALHFPFLEKKDFANQCPCTTYTF